jgi:4-hydroxythreonine-4-phosphate dehydrogenase
MAFCGGRLRVVLLTWHIPLREVPAQLTAANFARAVRAANALVRAEEPSIRTVRIGVCGLNPHAGEGGLLGSEERDVIDPLLDGLRPEFPGLSRTQAGDTVFGRQLRGEFDVALALYHDQGLAPLKTVDFDEAVNVTLGLPFVRTSPDHGTAFGLAGKGEASPRSFANAVAVAQRLIYSSAR